MGTAWQPSYKPAGRRSDGACHGDSGPHVVAGAADFRLRPACAEMFLAQVGAGFEAATAKHDRGRGVVDVLSLVNNF